MRDPFPLYSGRNTEDIDVAVVGLGYWGPHYARIVSESPNARLAWCCDYDADALALAAERYPRARCTTDLNEVLQDDAVDAVIVATPTRTHADISTACLDAGKDILVEKPLAPSLSECRQVHGAMGDNIVMVGHTFLFNPAVVALREMIEQDELGQILYVNSVRRGLGPIREDVNALWDLGPHDIAILLDLIDAPPVSVSAVGQGYLREHMEDVVYVHVRFANGVLGNAHLSWLDPYKVRQTTVVGDQRMAVFDDVAVDERLKILDRGASYDAVSEEARGQSYGDYRAVLRDGNITIPRVRGREPLREQLEEFFGCVNERRAPYSGVNEALQVVAVLEAAEESLSQGGAPVELSAGDYGDAVAVPSSFFG